jgi:hypothetical protein
MLIMLPVLILWVVAVLDVFRTGDSGVKVVGLLLMILVLPILGPILYFLFRKPEPRTADSAHMADEALRRERARQPVGPRVT